MSQILQAWGVYPFDMAHILTITISVNTRTLENSVPSVPSGRAPHAREALAVDGGGGLRRPAPAWVQGLLSGQRCRTDEDCAGAAQRLT